MLQSIFKATGFAPTELPLLDRTTKRDVRVHLDHVDPEAVWNEKLDIFIAAESQKNAVYLGFDGAYESYVFYLEYPINDNPADCELDYANIKMFKFDARHMLLVKALRDRSPIKASIISDTLIDEHYNPYSALCSDLTIYRCCYYNRIRRNSGERFCEKYIQKRLALPLCGEEGHVSCPSHLLPLNENETDINWTKELDNYANFMTRSDVIICQEAAMNNPKRQQPKDRKEIIYRVSMASTYKDTGMSDNALKNLLNEWLINDAFECVGCRWSRDIRRDKSATLPIYDMTIDNLCKGVERFQKNVSKDIEFKVGVDSDPNAITVGSNEPTSSKVGGRFSHPYYSSEFFNSNSSAACKYQAEFAQVSVGCPKSGLRHTSSDVVILKDDTPVAIKKKMFGAAQLDIEFSDEFVIYCKHDQSWKLLITDDDYYSVMAYFSNNNEPLNTNVVFDFNTSDSDKWDTDCKVDISDLFMTIHQIKSGMQFCISQHHHANLEPTLSIRAQSVKERHNLAVSNIILELETEYNGYRKIRGDGNCYYRAIIFGVLEDIVHKKDYKRLNTLRRLLEKALSIKELGTLLAQDAFSSESEFPVFYQNFTDDLLWLLGKIDKTWEYFSGIDMKLNRFNGQVELDIAEWQTREDFEDEVVRSDRLDRILVLVCRVLTSGWAILNQNRDCCGLPFMTAVDSENIIDYCRLSTMRWSESAEGLPVQLGALSEALQCDIKIVTKHHGGRAEHEPFGIDNVYSGPNKTGRVVICFRPGHYDLLYAKSSYNSSTSTAAALMPSDIGGDGAEVLSLRGLQETVDRVMLEMSGRVTLDIGEVAGCVRDILSSSLPIDLSVSAVDEALRERRTVYSLPQPGSNDML